MSNLIPLEDAARMLGLTVDKLNEMRSNSEIFGYKDGKSWKFKMQELDRVAEEFDIKINPNAAEAIDDIVDLVDSDDDFDIKLGSDDEMDIDLEESSIDLLADDDEVVDLEPVAKDEVAKVEDKVVSLDDDDDFEIDLEDSAEDVLDLKEDEPVLNLDDEPALDLDDEPAEEVVNLAADDDDDMALNLDDDDDSMVLNLDDDEDDLVLNLDDDKEPVLNVDAEEPTLDLDDEPVLNLDAEEPALDLDDDEPMFELDLDDDPVAEVEDVVNEVSIDDSGLDLGLADESDVAAKIDDLKEQAGDKVSALAGDAADKMGLSGELDLGDDDFDLSLDSSEDLGGVGTLASAAAGLAGLAGLAGAAARGGSEDDDEVAANDSGELDLGADSGEIMLSDDAIELDDDDIKVAAEKPEELSFGSSDIELAADGADDLNLDDSSDLLLDDEPSKGDPSTGKLMADDDQASDLMMSEEDLFEDDLEIQESHEDSIDLSSDFEDSDLIMDDSDSSAANDDSGFLLGDDDSEVDLSGGLMDLAGADDDGADEMIVLDDAADFDAPTELADDDFNLTPLEEVVEADASGSQVIALEDSEMYSEESAATLLSPGDEMESPTMLEDDSLDMGDFGGGFDAGLAAPGMAIATAAGAGALPEQPYTVWQIASLGLVLFLLLVGGMVGYDLARNLWLPEERIISGGVLPMIRSLLGG